MFKLQDHYDYSFPVRVSVPTVAGPEMQDLTLVFRVGSTSLDASVMERPIQDLLTSVVVGWSGVVDEDDEPIPFTGETFRSALALPFFHAAVLDAFRRSWVDARGNASAPSGGAG
jgi:hypothetical protein